MFAVSPIVCVCVCGVGGGGWGGGVSFEIILLRKRDLNALCSCCYVPVYVLYLHPGFV